MNAEKNVQKERIGRGVLGALLGALLGGAVIVFEDRTAGTFSPVFAVAAAIAVFQGYRQLAGGLSKRGAAICVIVLMAVIAGANQINCTMEVIETVDALRGRDFAEVFGAFEEIPEVREIQSWYQGHLLVLYLFCLLGSLPILVRAFRKPRARTEAELEEILLGKEPESDQEEHPELQGTLYPFRKAWMNPVRLSVGVPVVLLIVSLLAPLLTVPLLEKFFPWIIAAVSLGLILLLWITLTMTRQCNSFQILYVRAAGKLWRVNLMKLCRVGDWEALPPNRQSVVRDDILWELENILEGDFSAIHSGAITELRDIQAEKEDRWSWTVSYETDAGARKKLKIPKGYPDFVPVMGMERAEGPTPYRWLPGLAALALTAAILGGSFVFGQRWAVQNGEAVPEEVSGAARIDLPVRVPETYTEYELSEILFRMDAAFQHSQRRFVDSGTGTFYRVYTQYGVDRDGAWDTLTSHVQTDDPLYDRFQAVYSGEDLLAPLNETARYNIVSVYLTDGTVHHTAAVLSDTGALLTVEAEHRAADQSPEEVLANLMYTLKTVRFQGPEVTKENYQSQIHISEVRNCAYMAAAYLKTDLFGHDAFVDVYIPYSDAPIYAAEGRAVRTEAHGLRVYAAIVPGENAKAVIEERQRDLEATGVVYEEGVDDQFYREDLNAAGKRVVYEENGHLRNTVIHAEELWEGYCLLKEITGVEEGIDEDYQPLLKELDRIYGLTIPALEQLEEES